MQKKVSVRFFINAKLWKQNHRKLVSCHGDIWHVVQTPPLSPVGTFTGTRSAVRRAPRLSVWARSIRSPRGSGLFVH